MQLTESSIYISLKQLRDKLYQAQFLMDKANRIIYGTPLMQECGMALQKFVLAFTIRGRRLEYLEECIGWFAILRIDLEFCIRQNMIHYKKKVNEEGGQQVNSQKIELFRIVAKIDNDMNKWLGSLAKGKTIVEYDIGDSRTDKLEER